MRVRPYYIYQCDLSMGIEHFRTPVSKGIEIIEGLRGHTSGYAVPTFVVDAPGGGEKHQLCRTTLFLRHLVKLFFVTTKVLLQHIQSRHIMRHIAHVMYVPERESKRCWCSST